MAASAGDACRGARRRAAGQDGAVGQDRRGGSEPTGGAGPWSRVDCGALAGRSGGKRRLEAQPARLHCGARSRMPFCRGRRHAGEDRPKRGAGLALRVPSGRKKRSGASACLPPRLRLRPRRPPTQIARRTFQTWQVKLGEVQIEWRLGQVCWTRGPDGAPALPLGHSVRSAAVTAHSRPPLGRPDPELRCSGCAGWTARQGRVLRSDSEAEKPQGQSGPAGSPPGGNACCACRGCSRWPAPPSGVQVIGRTSPFLSIQHVEGKHIECGRAFLDGVKRL